jgi:competence protein ComGE
MLLKNKGFYMAELLLSLSCWILMASMVVPMLVQLNKQSVQIQEKQDALHILYEYMREVRVDQREREDVTVTKENKAYRINWRGAGKSEVSIIYEDVFGETIQIHEYME